MKYSFCNVIRLLKIEIQLFPKHLMQELWSLLIVCNSKKYRLSNLGLLYLYIKFQYLLIRSFDLNIIMDKDWFDSDVFMPIFRLKWR